jgi:hypothetical protein
MDELEVAYSSYVYLEGVRKTTTNKTGLLISSTRLQPGNSGIRCWSATTLSAIVNDMVWFLK